MHTQTHIKTVFSTNHIHVIEQKLKCISDLHICCPKNKNHEVSVNLAGQYVCTVCKQVIGGHNE